VRPRARVLFAALLALLLALAPAFAEAAAGNGGSFGSRGNRTYVAPPSTNTSPYGAAPMQRSLTPRSDPSYNYGAPGGMRGYGGSFGRGSPFLSGLMGGFIGAGLAGLLFGHGMFWGISGFGGLLGLLLQVFLVVLLVRWLARKLFGQPAYAGAHGYGRGAPPPRPMPLSGSGAPPAIAIGPEDYRSFEQMLHAVQAAWSTHDLNRLRQLATPEMVSYFAEQLAEQASRGVRNIVSDVRLEQGDLAEAWAEDGREYATVAMRFAMHDATVDAAGRVVDGSRSEWVTTTEYWTFLRAPGGRWVLSAIQQAAR
jgi:predicted lipid-binding transport protein (Tim44 family)